MKLSTKASLCSALFLAFMILPTAQACGSHAYIPATIIPMAILMSWPAVAASMAFSIPISFWRERKARNTLVAMLRDGACINDTKHVMRRARIQGIALVLAMGAASPYVFGWTMQFVYTHAQEHSYKISRAYYYIAMVPEQIAEQWLGEPTANRLNDIIY